jgi:hypothetical protein
MQIAFPGARIGERERIASLLGARGFAGLFEEPSVLRRLAHYSLEFGGRGAMIADVAAATGTTSDALRAEIGSLNSRAQLVIGFNLFDHSAEGWLTSVV